MAIIQLEDYRTNDANSVIQARIAAAFQRRTPSRAAFTMRPNLTEQGVSTTLVARWIARIRHRQALRQALREQPNSVIEDAGYTRSEARREAGKPFWLA